MDTTDDYRDLVEQQQDCIVRFTPEGRLLYANPAYCELVGKSREELKGSVFMPVTERQYADVIATQMVKLFRRPFACNVDQWIQTKKGLRCISWSARSIRDENGTVISIVATGRDLTDLKRQEKEIRKRDRELMLVVESGSRMYYSHTPEHMLDYVSPRILKLLGCKLRSGKKMWTEYLSDHPANKSGLERTLRAIASGKREPPYRLEFIREDGSRIWVEVNEIPIVKDGKTIAIVGSLADVTEKLQVEEGMAEAEILIKASRSGKNQRTEMKQSPLGYFRSMFGKAKENAEEDDSGVSGS
ncbi:MAG: putative diguanylate cyclase [Methanoregula sp. PtaU1.Bin051]|nr:MAG: putative diguanylate cyclase [Methanoregula sp. PtaU1.Bin051]